ncbi:MAG: thioredoxin domain-containing protein [Patescibacteria group bacterium]
MSSNLKQIALWILGALVVLGIIIGIAIATTPNGASSTPPVSNDTLPVAGDWLKGSKDAKVQVIEYSDLQCPACSGYDRNIKQLTAEFGDKIGFTYRHFPLKSIHKNAERASWAAEAAGSQGKFWEMHDKLFDTQSQWSDESDPLNRFIGYAKDLGLDENKFKTDFNSSSLHDKVNAQLAAGERAGVDATPTLFLNGKKIELPRSYNDLKNLVQAALDQ